MKLRQILESIGRFKPQIRWHKESPTRFYAEFDVEGIEEFYIQVDVLFEPRRFASVVFGKFNELGVGSVKTSPSRRPVVVISTVVGAVKHLLEQLDIDVAVFSAKEEHGQFESKSSLYRRIAERIEKDSAWHVFTRTKRELEIYVLSKNPLTKDEISFVMTQMGSSKK